MRRARLILVLGLALVALALFAGAVMQREMERVMAMPITPDGEPLFHVGRGESAGTVATRMAAQGWIPDRRWFIAHARLDGQASRIKAGTYRVEPGDTPAGLLARMVAGDTVRFEVRFIEGTTVHDLLDVLRETPHIELTLDGGGGPELMRELSLEEAHPEGLFFPATYAYDYGTSDREILLRAYRRMRQVVGEEWQTRAADLPYRGPYEALIMASIVEKETGQAAEREQIAGVFVRRLDKNMKLQTDPTVIYGLGAGFDGNLTRRDLRQDTPYNTYTRHGLPPTPIALPGRAAIHAALNPAAGNALYFVAKGDGTHQFSATLREHNNAVRRYQLKK